MHNHKKSPYSDLQKTEKRLEKIRGKEREIICLSDKEQFRKFTFYFVEVVCLDNQIIVSLWY